MKRAVHRPRRSFDTGQVGRQQIDMQSLRHTLTVVEHLNFRHAANAMRVSQSSVSARVKALEKSLGVLLFERHARGVRLTEAGRHFVERVATGIDHLDHAFNTAGMVAAGECGRLRIGLHALIPGSFLAELIARYCEDHPGVEVDMTEGTARNELAQLRAGRLDILFVAGRPEPSDCHTRPIWTEPLRAVLPDRHRLAGRPVITWADLVGETFLVRQGSTGPQVHDHVVLRLAGRWPAPSIRRADVGRGTLLSMVGQGFGITIVGAATALLPTTGIVLLPIADEPEPVAFSAVWSPFNQGAALRNLLELAGRIRHCSASPDQLHAGDHAAV